MANKSFEVRWSSNIKALITEEIQCNSHGGILSTPWKITFQKLLDVANVARRIGDPELDLLMCELALYTVGDGYHEDYNPEVVGKVREKAYQFKNDRLSKNITTPKLWEMFNEVEAEMPKEDNDEVRNQLQLIRIETAEMQNCRTKATVAKYLEEINKRKSKIYGLVTSYQNKQN